MTFPVFDITPLTLPPPSKHGKPAVPYDYVPPAQRYALLGFAAMFAIICLAGLFGFAVIAAKLLVALVIGGAIALFGLVAYDAIRNYFEPA